MTHSPPIANSPADHPDHDETFAVTAEDGQRLQGQPTGRVLVEVLQASPYPEIELGIARPAQIGV